MQLAAMGIHTFILKYSLAPDVFPASLMELAETYPKSGPMQMPGWLIQTGSWSADFLPEVT